MDPTIFNELLATAKAEVEAYRTWQLLQTEDATQTASPQTNQIANSLYLTPFNLPGFNGNTSPLFLKFYTPKRSIVLVSNNGITFRWYYQIPASRKHEYKDDDTRFYIQPLTGQLFLCGTLDQQYTIHQFYIQQSPAVIYNVANPSASTSWIFGEYNPGFDPILGLKVASIYRDGFKYDVINQEQADRIDNRVEKILESMIAWDGELAEQEIEGVEYPTDNNRSTFINRVVGDNNEGPWG